MRLHTFSQKRCKVFTCHFGDGEMVKVSRCCTVEISKNFCGIVECLSVLFSVDFVFLLARQFFCSLARLAVLMVHCIYNVIQARMDISNSAMVHKCERVSCIRILGSA